MAVAQPETAESCVHFEAMFFTFHFYTPAGTNHKFVCLPALGSQLDGGQCLHKFGLNLLQRGCQNFIAGY